MALEFSSEVNSKFGNLREELDTLSGEVTKDSQPEGDDKEVLSEDEELKTFFDPTKFQTYTGVKFGGDGPILTNRFIGGGTILKGNKYLNTDLFGFLDMDGNPVKTRGSGMLYLDKEVYKGVNLDANFIFTGTGNNIVRYGIAYKGAIKDGGYKLTIYPMNNYGKSFDVMVSGTKGVGKNGEISTLLNVDFLGKTFAGETEFVQNFSQHLAGYVQARYGGLIKKPEGGIYAGVRLNIK